MVVPIFKSQYSLGKSILNLSNEDNKDKVCPDSIINICKQNKLKEFCLVDDSMTGFAEAYKNADDNDLFLAYGLRLTFCEDISIKNEESLSTNCKYIIFIKDTEGHQDLIKIHDVATKDGFYYQPRMDFKILKKLWTKNLMLCVPFYDSFIHKNVLEGKSCIPEFDFIKNVNFFIEDNNLPFDDLLKQSVEEFTQTSKGYNTVDAQSIYYKDKKDFKAYLTFRCINKRTTLNKPNLEHMCSDTFCFESWKEKNEKS
tara:strand:- start:219 stop:986 length:768 start_codon:yes stop_codon:yes gene_type:complete